MSETDAAGLGSQVMPERPNERSAHRASEGPARRFVLASIGAAAVACDVAADRFDEFVNRGRQVRDEMQDKADEVRQNAGARVRVRDSFRTAMDVFLDGLNIPSKADMDTINVKLNILSRKLDDLQMERVREASGESSEAVPPSTPPPPADLST